MNNIQTKIESLCEINIDDAIAESNNFEDLYFKVTANINLTTNNYNTSKINLVPLQNMNTQFVSPPTSQSKSLNVKLLDINLPKFNGNYNKWLEVHDTFMSVVHNDDNADIQYQKIPLYKIVRNR